MTQSEKIQNLTEDFQLIKSTIQEKYDKVMSKIMEYQEKIDTIITNAMNQTKQWVDKQIKKIKEKIKILTDKIKVWLEEQLRKAQEWMDNIKKEIEDFIAQLLLSIVEAMLG